MAHNIISVTLCPCNSGQRIAPVCACAEQVDRKHQIKMASSMSGMFSGQQPSGAHPVGGPGGPGQPGFPGAANRPQGGNTLVDELEASFEVRS